MTIFQIIDQLFRKSLVPLNNLRIKKNINESLYIQELRDKAQKVKIKKDAITHNQWLNNLAIFRNNILTKNPKNFLQWDVVRNTMFIGNALFILPEFLYLRKNNWNKWKKAITDKNYLPNEPYILYPKTNGNFIHHAYHLAQFEKITKQKIKDFDYIFEYGGGTGGMCLLNYNLGFKGKYLIYDLPILSATQNYFLKMNNLNAKYLCLDNINEIKKQIPKKGKGLFIATWSLSESPLEIRKRFFPLIRQFDFHLIGYQGQFNEINNIRYFKNYQKTIKINWWEKEIKQLNQHHYLFGFK